MDFGLENKQKRKIGLFCFFVLENPDIEILSPFPYLEKNSTSICKDTANNYTQKGFLTFYCSSLLAKSQRLQGKEVRFLTKRRKIFQQGIFRMFFYDQYPNRRFHQISFHIPLIVSKRAVQRHKIKRILIQAYEKSLATSPSKQRYKCFITIDKNKITTLTQLLLSKDKAALQDYLYEQWHQFFSSFFLQNAPQHTTKNHSRKIQNA